MLVKDNYLLNLSPEILVEVLNHLTINELSALSQVSRVFQGFVEEYIETFPGKTWSKLCRSKDYKTWFAIRTFSKLCQVDESKLLTDSSLLNLTKAIKENIGSNLVVNVFNVHAIHSLPIETAVSTIKNLNSSQFSDKDFNERSGCRFTLVLHRSWKKEEPLTLNFFYLGGLQNTRAFVFLSNDYKKAKFNPKVRTLIVYNNIFDAAYGRDFLAKYIENETRIVPK